MIKEPLIKYVMEQANKCYADDFPIHMIEDWIREFFDTYEIEEALWPRVWVTKEQLKEIFPDTNLYQHKHDTNL